MNGEMGDFEVVLRGEVAVERNSRWWKCFCVTLASDFRGSTNFSFVHVFTTSHITFTTYWVLIPCLREEK
jgi:hypothetical protein